MSTQDPQGEDEAKADEVEAVSTLPTTSSTTEGVKSDDESEEEVDSRPPTSPPKKEVLSADVHRLVTLNQSGGSGMSRDAAITSAKETLAARKLALSKKSFSYGPAAQHVIDSDEEDDPIGVAPPPKPKPVGRPPSKPKVTPLPKPKPVGKPPSVPRPRPIAQPGSVPAATATGLHAKVAALGRDVVAAQNKAHQAIANSRRLAAKAQADAMAHSKNMRDMAQLHEKEWEARAAKLGKDVARGDVLSALSDTKADVTQLRSQLTQASAAYKSATAEGRASAKALQDRLSAQVAVQSKRVTDLQAMQKMNAKQAAQTTAAAAVPSTAAVKAAAGQNAVVAAQKHAANLSSQLQSRASEMRRRVASGGTGGGGGGGGEPSESDSDSDSGSESDHPVRPPDPVQRAQLIAPSVAPAAPALPVTPVAPTPLAKRVVRRALPVPAPAKPIPMPIAVHVGEASSGDEGVGEGAPLIRRRIKTKPKPETDATLGTRVNMPKDKINMFDRFLAYARPNYKDEFNGFLQISVAFLIAQCVNCIAIVIWCSLHSDKLYWQLNIFSYHDLRLSWSAALGWTAVVESVLGVVYQGFVFGVRRKQHNPSGIAEREKGEDPGDESPIDQHRKLDKTGENYWWAAGACFGIFDSCILVFMGANGLLTMIDYVALGLISWYIIKQADSRYDLLDDRVAVTNLSMAVGMKLYVITRILAAYIIATTATLETSWAGDNMASVFAMYISTIVVTVIALIIFRRSPIFPLVRDFVLLMIVVVCSWVIVAASTSKDNLPGSICSHSISGC